MMRQPVAGANAVGRFGFTLERLDSARHSSRVAQFSLGRIHCQ
jgi:hypothetical protein